jgi:hypothetical protein
MHRAFVAILLSGSVALAACSDSSSPASPSSGMGGATTGSAGGSAGSGTGGSGGAGGGTSPGIAVSVSGGAPALAGFDFPPARTDAPVFVDGWDVKFDRILTTVDFVIMYDDPDKSAADPSQIGRDVAEVDGPWAVDLHRSDPSNLQGKGGAGVQAVHIAQLSTMDLVGGLWPTDGTRFAIGFDLVAAAERVFKVNLDPAAEADYAEMVRDGCVVFYAGTATFKGDKTNPTCYPDDRKAFPDEVKFRFCFKSPTTYLNCQNPDNDPAMPLAGEAHQRGLAAVMDGQVMAQLDLHIEHPFWDSVAHGSPAHFDQFAARIVGQSGTPTVTLDDTTGVDYARVDDREHHPLAWRYCVEPSTAAHPKLTGPMAFDADNVPRAAGGDPSTGLRDYHDFTTYVQSTQVHLNAGGACFAKRSYLSPK